MIEELYGTKAFSFPSTELGAPNFPDSLNFPSTRLAVPNFLTFLYPGLQRSLRQHSISTGTVLQDIEDLGWNGEFQNTFYITHTYQTATERKISLLEAQKMAITYLHEVERKRQIEREREAEYWADLDSEE